MSSLLHGMVLFLSVVAASALGADVVRRWALRHRALDIPNARSSHIRPTPRGGGLAIVLATLLGWIAVVSLFPPSVDWTAPLTYLFGAILVSAVSWLDDLYSLSVKIRMIVHALGASVVVLAIGYWDAFPLLPGNSLPLGYAGPVITFFWIIGLTNAYNFMDGSDGIAGLQAVVAGLGWACMAWLDGAPCLAGLSLLLAAGSLGFLLHNLPPARIFMGDVGSAFLGYSFAVVPLLGLGENTRVDEAGPILGPLLVWPFVFDAGFTLLRRLRMGENVFAAHRCHLYQRLLIVGYSHRFVMLLYGALMTTGAAIGILWIAYPIAGQGCTMIMLPSLAWTLHRFVLAQERRVQKTEASLSILRLPPVKRRAA